MITKEQYEWLSRTKDGMIADEEYNANRDILADLARNGLMRHENGGCVITQRGKGALEEFERSEKAVDIAAVGNKLADEGNKIAVFSNQLSIASIIIALLALCVSVIAVLGK